MSDRPSDRSPGEGDELVAAFTRWAAEERVAGAASARSRARWLSEQATGGATWIGLLLDLAEQSALTTVALADTTVSGHLVGLGQDFCVLNTSGGRAALIALRAIAAIIPDRQDRSWAGDRAPTLEMSLPSALAALADDRTPVVMVSGTTRLEGRVYSVGEDVVILRSADGRSVMVPIERLSWCEIR